MAFTSGLKAANSDSLPYFHIGLQSGETRGIRVPNTDDANDQKRRKGDLWKIRIVDLGFRAQCVTADDISSVAMLNGGNDGWNIQSIVVAVSVPDSPPLQLLTVDMDINSWLDGNSVYEERKVVLTKV